MTARLGLAIDANAFRQLKQTAIHKTFFFQKWL